ncbi:putative chromosome-partitioning protein ParB (plasmid) [Xanthomonas hydrangeae]|uniref:ParB/RepB/Spo0J family partition protein n=1 Tax=Xanthomonas hydrangeae TaxID=2775159 RepID=UPI001962F426|nr:putative chromosome-partitioning protein ParB [Xanthomonas hydrangeae]CAD7740856.1 putative chromosome-partitioning protein ParB [Xanthomonas hydrangeae]CAD7747862.1 putative chromosome-partitioning protein ParB [Xanthomonas hydrangeae]CAD7747863.1 putative chromosome-partitioning protein ParB [Xanthomonas hydrangeae]CAD7748260.1 putative chromosome-partitioning protein ParB [Xanthomonas hydrangeae]
MKTSHRQYGLLERIEAAMTERPRPRHRDLALRLGVSRARVSNLIRVLRLPAPLLNLVRAGSLSPKHAEALLALPVTAREDVARSAIARGWTYAELCQVVSEKLGKRSAQAKNADVDMASLENSLGELLGTQVIIEHGQTGAGSLILRYTDLDTLDGLLSRLGYVS